MARHRLVHRATLVPILLVLLLSSSTVACATATPTPESYGYGRRRKLLVSGPRVSPETLSASSSTAQQDMHVGGWRTATPFRRPGASLGRRVPGSHANPSHN